MYSCNIKTSLLLAATLTILSGCGDNLAPSGSDLRPVVQAGPIGASVGQKSTDFSVSNINGTIVTLASALSARKAAVFYFTMWCPICDSHMNNMRSAIAPLFPDVNFFLVDYVTGSVARAF